MAQGTGNDLGDRAGIELEEQLAVRKTSYTVVVVEDEIGRRKPEKCVYRVEIETVGVGVGADMADH